MSSETNEQMAIFRKRAVYLLCLTGFAMWFYCFDRGVFSVALKEIQAELGFGVAVTGFLSTVFLLGQAMVNLPAGYLSDKYGRKSMLIFALVFFSAFTGLTFFAHGMWDTFFYRVMTGVGEGIFNTVALSTAGWLFPRGRAFSMGLWNFLSYNVGAMLGPVLSAFLMESFGWRAPFLAFGITGLIYACVMAVAIDKRWLQSRAALHGETETTVEEQKVRKAGINIGAVITNRNVILLSVFCAGWGLIQWSWVGLAVYYLRETLGFSTVVAASIMSIQQGFGGIANPIFGALSDKIGRKPVNVGLAVALTLAGLFFFNFAQSYWVAAVTCFIMGASAMAVYITAIGQVQDSVPEEHIGSATGFVQMITYLSAAVSGGILAHLKAIFGWMAAANIFYGLSGVMMIIAGLLTYETVVKQTKAGTQNERAKV